jgi:hypothetical protein
MGLLNPTQKRSLDPYDSNRWSSVINRFTRIVTGGRDVILKPEESFQLTVREDPVDPEGISYTSVTVSSGLCIKDDVLIHITEDYIIDFEDRLFYVDSSEEDDYMIDSTGYYILVLEYIYSRSLPSPVAYFRIIKDLAIYNNLSDNYIFLGTAHVDWNYDNEVYYIDHVYYTHPGVMPPIERPIQSGGTPIEVDGGYLNPETE